MNYTKQHPFNKKTWNYIRKLNPQKKYSILKNYLTYLNWKSSFNSVTEISEYFKINPKRPSKIKNDFDSLYRKIYPNSPVDYSINIFNKRLQYTFYRNKNNIDTNLYKYLETFISKYTRAWYDTFKAKYIQENGSKVNISRSTFNYYKPIIVNNLNLEYKKKSYKNKKRIANSKTFFDKLYKH